MTNATIPFQTRQAQTPAEDLRVTLDRLESELGKLGYSIQGRPTVILELLDCATLLLQELSAAGANLSPERGRFETATKQLRKKGKVFVKQIGGASAFETLRAERVPPPADAWWWYLDQQMAADRHDERKRTFRTLGIVAAVVAILSTLYALFLAPDKATQLRYRHEQAAESAIGAGNLTEALAEVEEALSYAPGDADLLVLEGAILDLLGDSEASERVYKEAQEATASTEQFLAGRVEVFLMAGYPERALEDTQQMVALYPDSPIGYYLMGNVDATLGNVTGAGEDYAKAGELASAAGRDDIEGMARVQLANLALMMSSPQMPTATPAQP